jgi:membrane-associated phospholipid phosphatase
VLVEGPVSIGAKTGIALGSCVVTAVLYMLPNRYYLGTAITLPWTQVDAWVPLVPATVWLYVSDYALVFSAFLRLPTWPEVKRFMRGYYAMLAAGAVVHFFWPTTFPRHWFPVPTEGAVGVAFTFVRTVDTPASCLPSMHVASSFFAAFSLWRQPRPTFLGWSAWALAVAVSTLTTKQHYVVDVLAGVALAVAFWAAFLWWPTRARR